MQISAPRKTSQIRAKQKEKEEFYESFNINQQLALL